ncbi:SpoIIE family protein phosphatase [uncultured Jatrophihabitans sp.]|uniref:SpoIIE family protein phosphatase n=1 Tax=uncultured Jatrophihabitans sp. TaxID=1610747 RepID=UPI0035CAEF7E
MTSPGGSAAPAASEIAANPQRAGATDGDGGLSSVLLPTVVHEASTGILVVDLNDRTVVFANDVARELAPDAQLPMSVDDWSATAGLADITGNDLAEGPASAESRGGGVESLLRIAQGEPVTGEAVTARRSTAATDARETLWVLGLPLSGASEPMSSFALVVFLPARNAQMIAGAQESAVNLRDRAVLATRMSFTITDPHQPDDPLVWVNPAFTATTGYEFGEAVGRNCRFLQGPDTDREIVAEIRASLQAKRPLTTTFLNYRKDGTTFWNELSISPVRDRTGEVTHFVGVQADVTARVEAQQARNDALSQVAQAADRLAMLADFTSRMALSQQPHQVVSLLTDVLVPRVGTWCVVYTYDEFGHLVRPRIVHERADTDPAVTERVTRLGELLPGQLSEFSPLWQVLHGEQRQVLVNDLSGALAADPGALSAEVAALVHEIGARSLVIVPLTARGGTLGAVALVTDDAGPELGDDELTLVRDIGVRAGLMLENTQLYARERATTASLQRSLLPLVPDIDGLQIAATYVPAADEAAVGGDWYDVFSLRDGGVGVVVGDVMGHNYDSAARMGKLSTIVRSYGWPGAEPHDTLTAVDQLIEGSGIDVLATCMYATLKLHEGGATLCYSSAGHPPAIVRHPDGSARALEEGRGPMLGVSGLLRSDSLRPPDECLELGAGSTLIFFTDGLVDSFAPEPDMDAGLDELCRLATELPADATPRTIVDTLSGAAAGHKDDLAVVAIRILP